MKSAKDLAFLLIRNYLYKFESNMTAPDKIYMPNELLSEEWTRHIEGHDTEYIRKDYLVEYLYEVEREMRKAKTSFMPRGMVIKQIIASIETL